MATRKKARRLARASIALGDEIFELLMTRADEWQDAGFTDEEIGIAVLAAIVNASVMTLMGFVVDDDDPKGLITSAADALKRHIVSQALPMVDKCVAAWRLEQAIPAGNA